MISRISSKGQVTIPADLRRALNLKAGSQVKFVLDNGGVRLLPARQGIEDLRGTIKVSEKQDYKAVRQQVMEEKSHGQGQDN